MRALFAAVVITGLVVLAGAAAWAGEEATPQVKVKPGHPKVMLTKEDIARTARNIRAGGPSWQTIKKQVDAGTAPLPVYGLVYLATEDKEVGKKGVEILMSDKTASAIAKGSYEEAALAYDWLYPLLSDEQKKTLFDRVKAGIKKDLAEKMDSPWTNFVQRSSMRVAIAGCAFASEFPEANDWVAKAYNDWGTFHLPAVKIVEEGGGWPEGALYGYIVYSSLTRLADTFWTATDKNPYEETRWFADRLTWWRFHTWPMPKDFGGRPFYMYDPYGDSERWRAPMQNQEIGAEFLVMRYGEEMFTAKPVNPNEDRSRFAAILGAATGWRWYMRQLHGPVMSLSDWSQLAYYEESSSDEDLVKSNAPLSWLAAGTGQLFIRSSWLPDATWIVYQCEPRFTYHQHLDQGQFNIFKTGDLTGESGVYEPEGPSDQEGHLQGYTSRAIAHNTLNIYNPEEVFSGYRSGNSPRNDGGERTWRPFSNTATSAAYWKDGLGKGAYDTGRITEFKDTGEIVYIASDLTGAYNSDKYVSEPNKSKVHEVTRQLVYFRPVKPGDMDCLVVFDRVRATNPAFEKRLLLHYPNDVRVAGKETKVAEGEYTYEGDFAQSDTGGGRLFVRTVWPEGAKINKIGGPGKEYWVYGKNFPVPNTPWERGYGLWRLEIMPPKPQTDDYYLTVYFPKDKSAIAAPALKRLSAAGALGVEIPVGDPGAGGKYRLVFPIQGEMGAAWMMDCGSAGKCKTGQFGKATVAAADAKEEGVTETTLPVPMVSNVKVSDVTTEAVVTWQTEKPTVGCVEFGDNPEMKYIIQPSEKPATEHKAVLRGLEPKSNFYVRAAAKDSAGNVGFSIMYTLETPEDKTPPKISELKAEIVNPTDATFSWSTDDRATGMVTAVDETGGKVTAEASKPAADQRVTLDGLTPDTEYTVTVAAKNSGGLESTSEPLKVKTPKTVAGYFETAFEDGKLDNWQTGDPSLWSIEKNEDIGKNVLNLDNKDRKRTTIVYKGHDYGDFTLRAKARTVEGEGNAFRDYCIVFGCQNADNYYGAWMCGSVDETLPGIVRVRDGKMELIGSRPNLITLADREWHNIEVVRKGTHIQAFFDGVMAFEADDNTFGSGKIGFGSNNDSAQFGDLKVIPTAAVAPAPPTVRTKKLTVEGLVME